jgi:glycerophosphoryl diester phosphodiesterase
MKSLKFILIVALTTSAMVQDSVSQTPKEVNIQGHRGCRGLFPENTIEAFEYAMKLGVSTLEMDIVLTSEGIPVVSHDPYMHHRVCRTPQNTPIAKEEEKDHNIFKMTLDECQSYICGSDQHPKFPYQHTTASRKPALSEVVELILNNTNPIDLNIEIKSRPSWDLEFHPSPAEYVRNFLKHFDSAEIKGQVTVQSFDARVMEELHLQNPDLKLVYLSEERLMSAEKKLDELSFKPFAFGPNYHSVNGKMVRWCRENGVHLSVWTVNREKTVRKLIELGVTDIITDYPDMALKVLNELEIEVSH